MHWKVAIIAGPENQRHLLASYKHLQNLGLSDNEEDGLHVFCSQGVKVNEGDRVIRHRSRVPQTEREVWIEALETMSSTYSPQADVFLFTTPDMVYWQGLKDFCDRTVEPNYMAMYFPYTPEPFYPDNASFQLPCSTGGAGWCETPITEVSPACNAIILHRHAARVVAAYLRDTRNHMTHCWANTVSIVLARLAKVRCYCAVPSFAMRRSLPSQRVVYGDALPASLGSADANYYLN